MDDEKRPAHISPKPLTPTSRASLGIPKKRRTRGTIEPSIRKLTCCYFPPSLAHPYRTCCWLRSVDSALIRAFRASSEKYVLRQLTRALHNLFQKARCCLVFPDGSSPMFPPADPCFRSRQISAALDLVAALGYVGVFQCRMFRLFWMAHGGGWRPCSAGSSFLSIIPGLLKISRYDFSRV
jgi:hypothetical protein